jgi:sialate O-acetylesterase
MRVEGNKIILHFEHVGGGLVADGGELLKGFAITGADRKFVWAAAKIDGDAVVVSSGQVSKPVAVRYAWANNPVCNLYNKAGLPASPFRTDDWPGITVGNK